MTTTEVEPSTALKPRSKPPGRRTPPGPERHANGTVDALAEMQRQIDELKAGGMRLVESAPANAIGTSRVAADEELSPWQLRVRAKTEPTPRDLERGEKNYNYPEVLYMKPDGSVVALQGDPQNRAYYTVKKRFHALTETEVREYLSIERPKIVKLQREKASLINTIRRAVAVDPALAAGLDPSWERDHDKMTVQELREQVDEIAGTPTASGQPRRMMRRLSRLEDADTRAVEAEAERLMADVETVPSRLAREAFENALPNIPRAPVGSRLIPVTRANAAQFS